jgi:hypothetical protein
MAAGGSWRGLGRGRPPAAAPVHDAAPAAPPLSGQAHRPAPPDPRRWLAAAVHSPLRRCAARDSPRHARRCGQRPLPRGAGRPGPMAQWPSSFWPGRGLRVALHPPPPLGLRPRVAAARGPMPPPQVPPLPERPTAGCARGSPEAAPAGGRRGRRHESRSDLGALRPRTELRPPRSRGPRPKEPGFDRSVASARPPTGRARFCGGPCRVIFVPASV